MSSLIVNAVNELECAMDNDDDSDIWGAAGKRGLDLAVEPIADLYVNNPDSREEIRREIKRISTRWPLVLYVRRVSVLINNDDDQHLFNRGLAVASMINRGCDYRDLIVSLVILRSAADRAGLDSIASFDAALKWSSPALHDVFRNVQNHSKSAIESTLASFGPPPKL